MTKEFLNYCRQVGKQLDCPKFMRDKFLTDTKRMTDNFLAENPGATLDELQNAIGEPDALAAMFLEDADSDAVGGYRKRKNRMKRLAVILLAAAFVAVTAFSIWAAHFRHVSEFTKESTITIWEDVTG